MLIDSINFFVSILRSSYLGALNFRSLQIKDELIEILSEKDYTNRPLLISTEIDDNGGSFMLLPVSKDCEKNMIYPAHTGYTNTINIYDRLKKKYEPSHPKNSYYDSTMFDICSIMDDFSDDEEINKTSYKTP